MAGCIAYIFIFFSNSLIAAEDERPVVDASKLAVEQIANAKLPTLHLVGDSTVKAGGSGNGLIGWGERIKPYFDTNKINVVNDAIGGRSARTYFNEGRWQKVADALKPGDFVTLQFGHNDQGRIADPANKHRADGPGIGDETVEDVFTNGTKEAVHTFGWYMSKFVSDAKARGATVVVCSPIPHKQRWETGRDFEALAGWDKEVARKNGVQFLDLTPVITDAYKKVGAEKVETFFADKGTHTSDAGAQLNAACVVAGLKSLPGNPLGNFFSDKAKEINPCQPPAETTFKFDFGGDKGVPGAVAISPTNLYSSAVGYGFEPGANVAMENHAIASTNPFYFSVKLPEGNYKVWVLLGDKATESTMTVKAELRRLMLEKIHVAAGTNEDRWFIVNVRTPGISDTSRVHLKPREQTNEVWAWDDKLTLEFNGTHPCVAGLRIEKADVPTVFLLGDSTVCDQPAEPWNSWGQMLPRFFKPEIAIANHAESGETIENSLKARRFEKVFSQMKPGDYLFAQFGHNDMKSKATNALEIYRADLKKVVARTRQLGGTPVLVTSMERKAGLEGPTLMGYPQTVRDVAKEENCALIDLNAMSLVFHKAFGKDLDKAFQDGTHHNNYGSYELAKCVVEGIRQDKLPLAKFIVDDFSFDPAKPDDVKTFEMPASPNVSAEKPLGN